MIRREKVLLNHTNFLLAKVLLRVSLSSRTVTAFNDHRHRMVVGQLDQYFRRAEINMAAAPLTKHEAKPVIWLFWWQGTEKMSPLVKKCYASILRNRGQRQVILITASNIRQYTNLPESIYHKVANGQITLTHLSDLLRFNLLRQYGGLWMDLTLYVTKSLDRIKTNQLFTCSGYPVNNDFNIARGRWTGFFIGGPAGDPLFIFMDNFFREYWRDNDYQLDYFLIDYGLNYAFDHRISQWHDVLSQYQTVAPTMYDLLPLLNQQFDQHKWQELTAVNGIFKLSNRKKITFDDNKNFFNMMA